MQYSLSSFDSMRSELMAPSFVSFCTVCILLHNDTHFSSSFGHLESQSYEENSPFLMGVNIFTSS